VVEPSGVSFEAKVGESIMEAAIRSGYTWPTICGGRGTCKTCVCLVLDGGENLSKIEDFEEEGLASLGAGLDENSRLACQAKPSGDVKVRKIGVRNA